MTTTYTANKIYALQGTGDNPNTWGTVLNTSVFSIIDANLGGRLSISIAGSSDVTLSQTQANNVYHTMTGVLTENMSYILPNQGGFFFFKNSSTGSFTTTVKPAGGTGVVVPQGSTMALFMNPDTGSAVALFDTVSNLSVISSTVPVSGNGIYLPSANTLGIYAGSALSASFTSTGLNNTVIGATTPLAGTFTTLIGNSLVVNGSTVPTNGIYLSATNTVSISANSSLSASFTSTGINNTIIGATTPLAGTFTTATANSFTPNNSTIPANGMYLPFANTLGFSANSALQFTVTQTASAVNRIDVTGRATGAGPIIAVLGSDTDITLNYVAKGAGVHAFITNGGSANQCFINHTAGATRSVNITGSNGGMPNITTSAGELQLNTGANGVAINSAALATNATGGFLWITSSAGAPTGTATAPYSLAAAMHYDSTNNFLYIRCNGTWRKSTVYA